MRETFLMIGERCNVAGSSIYKKAIVDGNYDKAASIATKQVLSQFGSSTDIEGPSMQLEEAKLPELKLCAERMAGPAVSCPVPIWCQYCDKTSLGPRLCFTSRFLCSVQVNVCC